jgi:hypothetical protein
MDMEALMKTLSEAAEWHTQHADWIQNQINKNPTGIGVREQAEQVLAHRNYAGAIKQVINETRSKS